MQYFNGKWNDRPSSPDQLLFPVCQTEAAAAALPGSPMVWGTGRTSSFNVKVCIDHSDTLFFQDDRLWLAYGGQWAPPGTHGQCPDRYHGKAYINEVEWDISSLRNCKPGFGCPVSHTFTDRQFEVPMGCNNIQMVVQQNGGRGPPPTLGSTAVLPTRANGFRGEMVISDPPGGSDVYDLTVTLTCMGAETGAPVLPVRLSCVNDFGNQNGVAGTASACHMGRIEVFNPHAEHENQAATTVPQYGQHSNGGVSGSWGTVCGFWIWDNDNAADLVCRQLGFASGTVYTFGPTTMLPTLPIVTGYRLCEGTERSLFDCPAHGETHVQDRDCGMAGCVGPDGHFGTMDDSVSGACTHNVDQGAICVPAGSTQQVKAERTCIGRNSYSDQGNTVTFGCVDFYTTSCSYDITNSEIAGGMGSYQAAMRAFAACASTSPEPAGFCHGSLKDAAMLSNQANCAQSLIPNVDDPTTPDVDESQSTHAVENIGFHIRIPFHVGTSGMFAFRYHMDMGLGSFMGVDGPEFRPGNTWGHLTTEGSILSVGEHEWEVLGFEDCCDGHAELEVHIPCDNAAAPWRLVSSQTRDQAGNAVVSPCLSCNAPINEQAQCSAQTEPAACCAHQGSGYATGGVWNGASGAHPPVVCTACDDPNAPPATAHVGRFIAIGQTMSINDAIDYCEEHYSSIASLHTWEEQQQAQSACEAYADKTQAQTLNHDGSDGNAKYGCWIGFQDLGSEGGFLWTDGSSVEFVDFAPGEPNDVGDAGEDAVEMDFRTGLTRFGEWNDASNDQAYEMFPLCQTSTPQPIAGAPMTWGTDTVAHFDIRVCIDQDETLYFQDDRLWFQYGGQYAAAGTHGDCPDRYQGRAYVNSVQWDISSYGAACTGTSGGNCPVSPTFTDHQFKMPMGCASLQVQATKVRGRGTVTAEQPTAGNGYRGGIQIQDLEGGSNVYDVRVSVTCQGVGGSTPVHPVRLSCAHNLGTASCHMGRIEVFQPAALHIGSAGSGTWGSVCGHWYWDNDNMADIVCRQLGYSSGTVYTYGHTTQLPDLPIVAGFRTCEGTEQNIFGCPEHGTPDDRDCAAGCLGDDGLQGTHDDTLDYRCTHTLDQGAICSNDDQPSQMALPTCQGSQSIRTQATGYVQLQPIVFSCVEYYTTPCIFDIEASDPTVGWNEGPNNNNFMSAMRAFAQCADAAIETPGYCHGSLNDARTLANQDVCTPPAGCGGRVTSWLADGACLTATGAGTTCNAGGTCDGLDAASCACAIHDIGFHIRIPFIVTMAGTYAFRMHADYGRGSYTGVDGAEHTPGATWGHNYISPSTLAAGEHEFESLGFEDCCDGWAQLEVHLPCDSANSAWRLVQHGETECMQCGTVLSEECQGGAPVEGR